MSDLIKALELMVYPRHMCVDPGLRGAENCAKCGKNWRDTDAHFVSGESAETDKLYAIATLAKAKTEGAIQPALLSHIERMQDAMRAFIEPDSAVTKDEFVNQMIHLLDGPEQREAMAA